MLCHSSLARCYLKMVINCTYQTPKNPCQPYKFLSGLLSTRYCFFSSVKYHFEISFDLNQTLVAKIRINLSLHGSYQLPDLFPGLPVQQTAGKLDTWPGAARGTVCQVGDHSSPACDILDVWLHLSHRLPNRCAADMRTTEQRVGGLAVVGVCCVNCGWQ